MPLDARGVFYQPIGTTLDCRHCGWPAEGETSAEATEVRDRHEKYDCPANPDRVRKLIFVPGSPLNG